MIRTKLGSDGGQGTAGGMGACGRGRQRAAMADSNPRRHPAPEAERPWEPLSCLISLPQFCEFDKDLLLLSRPAFPRPLASSVFCSIYMISSPLWCVSLPLRIFHFPG